MSCFIGRKWGPVLVGKGTKSVCVCACIPHTVRIYVRGWVCACEEEMVGEKKGSGVGLGTGTKSIIIAVRITPALHTEQSSLSLSLSLYRSVSHSPHSPPKSSQPATAAGWQTPIYSLHPSFYFMDGSVPGGGMYAQPGREKRAMGARKKKLKRDLCGPFKRRPAG